MTTKRRAVLAALIFTAPVAAQDLPTDQLERHVDVVRQDMLLKSTMGNGPAHRNDRARRAKRNRLPLVQIKRGSAANMA